MTINPVQAKTKESDWKIQWAFTLFFLEATANKLLSGEKIKIASIINNPNPKDIVTGCQENKELPGTDTYQINTINIPESVWVVNPLRSRRQESTLSLLSLTL